jgi:sugar phosphate isomerase/epimerase
MTAVQVPGARVALSTASVYPENCATAFDLAERLGYDGVEVMVWTDPVSQEAGALQALADLHGMPVVSVHAPTLLVTQRVWGPDAWSKIDNSIEMALALGADTVVLHPPFRWQKEYAAAFVDGVALREHDFGIRLAVENMFPWRARTRSRSASVKLRPRSRLCARLFGRKLSRLAA